jgi:hypothetical protein
MAAMKIDISEVVNGAIDKIKQEGYTVQKWIPCEDELPTCNGCYLVWRPHFYKDGDRYLGEATVCYFDGQDTWHDSYGVDFSRVLGKHDVTHWMPLPEPPEKE